jgi:hypothetical protein
MKLQRHALLLLCCATLGTGVVRQRSLSREGYFVERLAGVRRCLSLHAGDEMEVLAMKQRYGKGSFLVARPAGSPKLVAKAALHATYEALLRGDGAGCADASDQGSMKWFLDVGTDDDELLALASSLGCGVTVLDPEVKDVRAVDMTRCMNEEPSRPFVVFQVTASNITNPASLANMSSVPFAGSSPVDVSSASHKTAFLGSDKPTMLNGLARKKRDAERKEEAERQAAEQKAAEQKAEKSTKKQTGAAPKTAPKPKSAPLNKAPAKAAPLESGVMLDTVFTRSTANASDAAAVKLPSGADVLVNKIALLKVTPRSESDATIKALQGARSLLESGRVKCLVTEMNFDLNHSDTFLKYVTELEHTGFQFAHLGSLDYSELEVTDQGQYEVFRTDAKQLQELFDTYKRIRSFDERSGFRVYSGSLSLDRKGHYFDYTDLIFACRDAFPKQLAVLEKGKIRFRNGVWWLEKNSKP